MAERRQSVNRLDPAIKLETREHLSHSGKVLSFERIEERAKPVFFADGYIETARESASDRDLIAAVTIQEKIVRGDSLMDYYRGTTNYDFFLHRHNVMHLHLSSKSSRAVLYLVQFENCVLFLKIASHIHLTERPLGVTLGFENLIKSFLARRFNQR